MSTEQRHRVIEEVVAWLERAPGLKVTKLSLEKQTWPDDDTKFYVSIKEEKKIVGVTIDIPQEPETVETKTRHLTIVD